MSTDKIGSPNLLAEMNAGQLSEQQITPDKTIAVLIFGACENHGNHLPFGADFIMPFELAKRVAMKHKNILVLPALSYGVSSHHKDFAMTMSLQPETMIAIIFDLMESLVQNKVRRILVINGHDGNIAPIELASRKIKEKYSKVVISCMESWWTLIGQLDKDLFEVWNGMGHGGEADFGNARGKT
jgi:creatinine amidohydrolase